MKKRALFAFAVLLVAGGAWAVGDINYENVNGRWPTWIKAGLYIGNGASNVVSNNKNKITRILGSGLTGVSFGALDAGCAQSGAITVTGARVGDICLLGQATDTAATGIGGTNASADCSVTASDAVKVRVCVTPSPTGTAVTVGDAGVNVMVLSNQ